MNENLFQSAAKPIEIQESSETISTESTLDVSNGSGRPLTCNDEGDDIVQNPLKENFIKKATLKFNGKFDYSKVKYVNAKTKVIIICPEHGEFQQTPDKHLQSKFGCPKCSLLYKDKSSYADTSRKAQEARNTPVEQFLQKANQKYNNKFTYEISNWKNLKSEITVICPKHGKFTTTARAHLCKNNTNGCPYCGAEQRALTKTDSYDDVIQQFRKIHGDKYIYPEDNRIQYVNKQSKLKIICPEHGEFIKSAQKHLSGQGCFHCRINELIDKFSLPGGYCEQLFLDNPELKEIKGCVYYLKINNGNYYKIGISKNHPNTRIKSLISKAKQFNEDLQIELVAFKEYSLYDSFKIEQFILNKFKQYRIRKNWSTELFNVDIYKNIQKVFN